MPLALLIVGLLVCLTGLRGNYTAVAAQLTKDFSQTTNVTLPGGPAGTSVAFPSYFVWMGCIIMVAVVTKALHLPDAGKVLIALIIVVFVISAPGIFTQFEQAITQAAPGALSQSESGNTAAADVPGASNSAPSSLPSNLTAAAMPTITNQSATPTGPSTGSGPNGVTSGGLLNLMPGV